MSPDVAGVGRRDGLGRVPRAAVRDRLLRPPACRHGAQPDRQRHGLRAVARGLRHLVDVLRERRAGRRQRRRVPADLPWPHAHGRHVVADPAQGDPDQPAPPDHLARRLRVRPLRQEHPARWAGHSNRGGRDPALHRAAAEVGLQHIRHPPALPGDHLDRGAGAGARSAGHRPLRCAAAGRVHDRVRYALPRRDRAPRGHGRRDRLRVGGEADRLPRRRSVRDVRHVRRARRPVRQCRGERSTWTPCSRRRPRTTSTGCGSRCCRCSRSCCCRDSGRSRLWRTSTSGTSCAHPGCSRSTCWSSTSSCCRSRSAGCSGSATGRSTPTRTFWRCQWPRAIRRWRCWSSWAASPPRPG